MDQPKDQLYELICIHPFGNVVKGQHITDADEVEKHLDDREGHFIRIPKPAPPPEEPVHAAPAPKLAPAEPVAKPAVK